MKSIFFYLKLAFPVIAGAILLMSVALSLPGRLPVHVSSVLNATDQLPGTNRDTFIAETTFFQQLGTRLRGWMSSTRPEKAYLQLDRTFFKPGESVWFSAFVRDAATLKAVDQSGVIYIEWINTKGAVSSTLNLIATDGRAHGSFLIPADAPGGIYKIKAYTNWQKNEDAFFERDITVQAAVIPRLNMKMEFERKAYGAGDQVTARLDLFSLSNQPLVSKTVTFKGMLDGREFSTATATTDNKGRVYLKTNLPANLSTNDGLLLAMIEYNGQTESVSRSIPIVLNKISLQFFPEGGDLVTGLPGKVAFEAMNEFGKPADISGYIANSDGKKVADFSSFKFGMGAFEFHPEPGETYRAHITQPAGIRETFELPESMDKGFTVKVLSQQGGYVQLEVNSNVSDEVYLVGRQQDKLFYKTHLSLYGNPQKISVPVSQLPIGITSFTLFDSKEIERCERLVFVNPERQLRIDIKTDKEKYLPREKVKMSVKITDEKGLPVPGTFAMSVADESVLSFADDKQGHILSYMLLETELQGHIEEPNFYFDKKEPKAVPALDFLLMTHGWRKFSWEAVQDNNRPVMAFQKESGTISGKVVDQHGNPVAGSKLTLYPFDKAQYTDARGDFAFNDVTLYQQAMLKVNCQGDDIVIPVNDYQQNINIRVRKRYTLISRDSKEGTVLTGKVSETLNGEVVIGAKVELLLQGKRIGIQATDLDGIFKFKNLVQGNYDLVIQYVGYDETNINGILVSTDKLNNIDVEIEGNTLLNEVNVVGYRVPSIQFDNTVQGGTVTASEIVNMPARALEKTKTEKVGGAPTGKKSQSIPPPPPMKASDKPVKAVESKVIEIADAPAESEDLVSDNKVRFIAPLIKKPVASEEEVPVGNLEKRKSLAKKEVSSSTKDIYSELSLVDDAPSTLSEVVVVHYKVPVLIGDGFSSGASFNANQIVPGSGGTWYSSNWVKPMKEAEVQAQYVPTRYSRVREFYAPVYKTKENVQVRTDFRSTLYWNPAIEIDKKGRAEIEFYASDDIANFRVTVEGLSHDGTIGRQETHFYTQLPFGLLSKAPAQVLTGDTLLIPVTLMNNTEEQIQGQLEFMTPAHFKALGAVSLTQEIAAGESKTVYLPFLVGDSLSEAPFMIGFNAAGCSDYFTTTIKTISRGFPTSGMYSGKDQVNIFDIQVNSPIEGTMKAKLTAYPNTVDEILSGMERMLRQPSGCFEQTSSSNYPNLLVLDYLQQAGLSKPEIESNARQLLADGYQRLIGYESKNGGFEWFGNDPGHEALTAYGLMQFTDMSRVYEVNQEMIKRTAKWLLGRRDGKGSWLYSGQGLHSWHGVSGIRDAYITWALCEAGYGKEITKEIEYAYTQAIKSEDSYQLALVANIMTIVKDKRAAEMTEDLIKRIEKEGYWVGKSQSVTCSTGQGFRIETTALVALAMMKSGKSGKSLQEAMDFIARSKSEYGFGNTQSTVLALKALVAYTAANKQTKEDGRILVWIDGKKIAEKAYEAGEKDNIVFEGLDRWLTDGNHRVEVRYEGTNSPLPFEIEMSYASLKPASSASCALRLETDLSASTVRMGETVRLTSRIENTVSAPVASPLLMVGIPAGLSPQPWQLKELKDKNLIAYYEIFDGYLVFYFNELAANEVKNIHLDLKADIAGTFEAPASKAYLYYTNEWKQWSQPERIKVIY